MADRGAAELVADDIGGEREALEPRDQLRVARVPARRGHGLHCSRPGDGSLASSRQKSSPGSATASSATGSSITSTAYGRSKSAGVSPKTTIHVSPVQGTKHPHVLVIIETLDVTEPLEEATTSQPGSLSGQAGGSGGRG